MCEPSGKVARQACVRRGYTSPTWAETAGAKSLRQERAEVRRGVLGAGLGTAGAQEGVNRGLCPAWEGLSGPPVSQRGPGGRLAAQWRRGCARLRCGLCPV